MTIRKLLLAAPISVLALSSGAFAQDAEAFQLPEACASPSSTSDAMDPATGMADMDLASMTDAQRENMTGMMQTMPAMHQGMMHDDPDIAFVCAMIPHHQGAIDMAEVQLRHGEDEQLRAWAQDIIDAQSAEIEAMTQWLADNVD